MLGLVFACFGVALFLSLPVALGMGLATILPSTGEKAEYKRKL